MTDEGALGQQDPEEITQPVQPRGTYAGYKAFGGGDGAVLLEPGLIRQLRFAAELATEERRCTGGLLFGRRWADDQGAYLVVSGFTEAGPDEDTGDVDAGEGGDDFTLSETGLRLMREDAARTYPAGYEVGWWRTLAALGEFGPGDLATQAELVGPGGVGLLVYGSGIHWGTAYLGPVGRAPDSAGTLVVAAGHAERPTHPEPVLVPGTPAGPEAVPEAVPEPEPEVVNFAVGESMLEADPPPEDPPPTGAVPPAGAAPETAAPGRATHRVRPAAWQAGRRVRPAAGQARQPRQPGRTRQRVSSRVRVPSRARARAARPVDAGFPDGDYPDGYPGRELPADYQLVVLAMAAAFVAAAIIVGFLVHSLVVAVIIAAVGLLVIAATVWMSHYH